MRLTCNDRRLFNVARLLHVFVSWRLDSTELGSTQSATIPYRGVRASISTSPPSWRWADMVRALFLNFGNFLVYGIEEIAYLPSLRGLNCFSAVDSAVTSMEVYHVNNTHLIGKAF
jgi:hypothetical protein